MRDNTHYPALTYRLRKKREAKSMITDYTFVIHKHRFAAWAGATAASTSPLCRFKVSQAVALLENTTIARDVETKEKWKSAKFYDDWHRTVCDKIVLAAEKKQLEGFSFGVAAKLVNVYVKAFALSELNEYKYIHPPVDSILLNSLKKNNFGGKGKFWGLYKWSKLAREEYYELIQNLRESIGSSEGLWTIESHWQGFQ